MARASGARVPAVAAVRTFGAGVGVLVTEHVQGTLLRDAVVDDALVADLWAQVERLHDARVAHGDLHAGHVVVDGERRAWLVDFELGESGAEPGRLHQDVAELLASLVPLVGAPAALASARAALGEARLGPVAGLLRSARRSGESQAVQSASAALLQALDGEVPASR